MSGAGDSPPHHCTPYELVCWIRAKADEGIEWAQPRKHRFRRAASTLRLTTLGLTGASSVILGLQNLDCWGGLGFSLVTVATLVGAMESFFNWRSRWVLMESAQYRLRRIHDEIDYLLRATPPDQLTLGQIEPFFHRWQNVWTETSERWLEQRRTPNG
jgi:hypothetical protein